MNLTETVIIGMYSSVAVLFVFIAPFLSMRLLADEKRLPFTGGPPGA